MYRQQLLGFRPVAATLLAVCLAHSPAARGEVKVSKPDGEQGVTVYQLTVTPAAAADPAFHYRLLPPDIELTSGNAAPFYYRAMLALRRDSEQLRKEFNEDAELSQWYATGEDATPLAALPLDKLRRAVEISTGGQTGKELSAAVKRRDCDWQTGIEEMRGPALISFPLTEFQETRQLARMVSLRTRLALAEGRFDDAIQAMQTNYRLAQDAASELLLVCGLIGNAIAGNTNGALLELIAAPNSPNMYWAVAALPQPLVDMKRAVRFELSFAPRMFPFIRDAETTDRSPAEWNWLYQESLSNLDSLRGQPAHCAVARSEIRRLGLRAHRLSACETAIGEHGA